MKKHLQCILFLGCYVFSYAQQPDTTKLVTAFGKPQGKEVSAKIDKDGGTLVSPDGKMELIIPPGAVSKKTTISIQPVTNVLPGGRRTYHLKPAGINFNKPVDIIFHYDNNERNGNDLLWQGIAMQDEQGRWHNLTNIEIDSAGQKISGKIRHFSYWVDYERVSITPSTGRVKVNKEISLQLSVYEPPNTDSDEDLPPLPPASVITVSRAPVWSVNGITNGNSAVGTIRAADATARNVVYRAPASVPDRNPVAVTAELKNINLNVNGRTFTDLKVTSNILVYDKAYEVKITVWVDETGLFCGASAIDEGSFIVELRGSNSRVIDMKNNMLRMPTRGNCRCAGIWTNEATCLGPVHMVGVNWVKVTPPAPPAKPYTHVQVYFKTAYAVYPTFRFPCPATGGHPTMLSALPALPIMVEFDAKSEEQVIFEMNDPLAGGKITAKPLEDGVQQ